jgi:hypothetical protein
LNEYLHFLNIALASAGESVSGLHAFSAAKQIADADLQRLDAAAHKLENGLKRLIESLQNKKLTGSWDDSFVIRETNEVYEINTCTTSGLKLEYKQRAEDSIKGETDALRAHRSAEQTDLELNGRARDQNFAQRTTAGMPHLPSFHPSILPSLLVAKNAATA